MLLLVVFLLSTLARSDTESASVSTLLRVAPAAPVRRGGVIVAAVWCEGLLDVVLGKALAVVAGDVGDMRSSTGTSISVIGVYQLANNNEIR
jgi:hypothetical protein